MSFKLLCEDCRNQARKTAWIPSVFQMSEQLFQTEQVRRAEGRKQIGMSLGEKAKGGHVVGDNHKQAEDNTEWINWIL